MTRVGFVGLGQHREADGDPARVDGRPVGVRRRAGAGRRASAAGATAAKSVADVASRVDVLCVMVRDDDQVRAVAAEALDGGAPAGAGRALHGRAVARRPSSPPRASGCSTRRSAAARWAPPTARWRSWSAATAADVRRRRAGAAADGLHGRARRPARRRDQDEAGPQPDPLRRVHRGHRGAAAGRGVRPRPGRAGRGGPAHRRDHRRPGRDHVPRHHGASSTPTTSGGASSTTSGRWGRRTCRSRSSWPRHWASTYRSRSSRARTSRRAWVSRWASSTTSPRSAAAAWRRWRRSTASRCPTARVTSSATPPTTCSPTSGAGPASPTATAGCC